MCLRTDLRVDARLMEFNYVSSNLSYLWTWKQVVCESVAVYIARSNYWL